jgi:predicted permease
VKALRVLLSRVRGLGRGRRDDDDMREQIAAHLDEATDEYVRRGMPPDEARRAARLDFGSIVAAEERSRDARGRWMDDLARDLGYGLRMLRRDRAFTAVALLSLTVGIGANSAIFSVVDSMLLRPRPIADPARVVELFVGDRGSPYETTSYPSYREFKDRNQVFSGLAAYGIQQFTLGDANEVEQVWGEVVSANYFDVLGVNPALGRSFTSEAELAASEPTIVISHLLWQRRFNSDPAVLGRAITLNGRKITVVGIAPPQYTGMLRGIASEVWVPAAAMPLLEPGKGDRLFTSRGSRWLVMVGRLLAGVTVEMAAARFDVLTREMQRNHPEEWRSELDAPGHVRELFVSVLPESGTRVHPGVGLSPYVIAGLVMLIVNIVLLIACMNLAGMLLARAVVRQREIAVRLALGASRLRVVRQLMTESVLLSLIAGAFGIVLAVWLLHLLIAFMPPLPEGLRVAFDIVVDWRIVGYTVAFSMVVGALFGIAPALLGSRTEVGAALRADSNAFAGGQRRSRVRAALVIVQVALALLLLIGGGLVVRSLDNVQPARLGYSTDDIVVAWLTLNETSYGRSRSQSFFRDVSQRISALPGVRSVSLVDGIPGGFMNRSRRSTEIEGYQASPGETLEIDANIVGPRYFTNMKVPIVAGRDFDERDGESAPCVAIVNEAFGRRYLPDAASPLGKHLAKAEEGRQKQWCTIVGVVRDDAWQSLQESPRPFYWLALQQSYRLRMMALVHTEGDASAQIAAVRRAVLAVDPKVPVSDIQTLRALFGTMTYPFQLLAMLMGASGAMALLLATIGVFGIVAYSVAQRTRELGVRIALGAGRAAVLGMVVGQGMRLVGAGLIAGLLLSIGVAGLLTSAIFGGDLLFGVRPTDTLTFATVTILLALVAFTACCIPALRATRIDPVEALRCE